MKRERTTSPPNKMCALKLSVLLFFSLHSRSHIYNRHSVKIDKRSFSCEVTARRVVANRFSRPTLRSEKIASRMKYPLSVGRFVDKTYQK